MLNQLTLTNFALIESADVDLAGGFHVITGETGAGKSLLLDALALLAGARSDAAFIRPGQTQYQITASVNTAQLSRSLIDWLSERDYEVDEILVRRQVSDQNRSRAWINGSPVALSELKELGNQLLVIGSQHAQFELLKPEYVADWFDRVAGIGALAAQTHEAGLIWQRAVRAASESAEAAASRKLRIELLTHELEELDQLLVHDYEQTERDHELLSNLESIASTTAGLVDLIEGDETGMQVLLGRAAKLAQTSSAAHTQAALEHLDAAAQSVAEALSELRSLDLDAVDISKLPALDQRLSDYHRLARKYAVRPDELSQLAEDRTLELKKLKDSEQAANQQDSDELLGDWQKLAAKLYAARKLKAPDIQNDLLDQLRPLSLPKAQIEISAQAPKATPVESEPTQVLFSANKGMTLKPLNLVASGGELSRLALIMQLMDAGFDERSLLVFDEIDSGLSGAAAQVMGELLKNIGKHRQIIAITHQAQVAAQADHHLLVEKTHAGEQTVSGVRRIEGEEQVRELARMAGGQNITAVTMAHARSLMSESP